MKVRAQIGMVLNLDKCIGCHTCSVTCKNVWTSRPGMEYAWFNNVETKPGIGYPKQWENQEKWKGGWRRKTNGKIVPKIGGKLSLRASITSELVLDDVRVPAGSLLNVEGIKGPLSCLSEARFGIVWGVLGAARTCYETALEYAKTRVQWGKPIAGFQLTQEKLVNMALELNKGMLLALHIGRLKDEGKALPEHISTGKLNNVREALAICREARTILGANGITLEYPVIRHMNNLESVLTYEGTSEIHTLILGAAITGERAFS